MKVFLFVTIVLAVGALSTTWAADTVGGNECGWTRCPTTEAELIAQQQNTGSHCPEPYKDMDTYVDCNNPGVAVPAQNRPKMYKCCKTKDTHTIIAIVSKDKGSGLANLQPDGGSGKSPSVSQSASG